MQGPRQRASDFVTLWKESGLRKLVGVNVNGLVGVVGGTAESWMDLAAPGLVAQTGEKCAAEDSTEFGWHVF